MQEKSNKNTDISERISQIIDYLKITANKFSKNLGYDRTQTIYDIINMKCAPSYDFFNRILNSEYSESFNIDWIISGKGNMLKGDNKLIEPVAKYKKGIPLIPFSAMAGAFTQELQVLDMECEHFVVPTFKGADFLITVKGGSMYPKYNPGDIVACKKLPLDTFFQWNKVYVLDTDQGALIKRVKKGSKIELLLIVSENIEYEPFELNRTQIYNIALVLGVIRHE